MSLWNRYNLFRTLATGVDYARQLLLLRLSGRRTLPKMNSFALVVKFAFGFVLASLMVTKSVSLIQGVTMHECEATIHLRAGILFP